MATLQTIGQYLDAPDVAVREMRAGEQWTFSGTVADANNDGVDMSDCTVSVSVDYFTASVVSDEITGLKPDTGKTHADLTVVQGDADGNFQVQVPATLYAVDVAPALTKGVPVVVLWLKFTWAAAKPADQATVDVAPVVLVVRRGSP